MRAMVKKYMAAEREMSEEHGPFVLFALFLPEDSPHFWDVVVSATWQFEDKLSFFGYIADTLQKHLSRDEYLKMSRIVPIPYNDPGIEDIRELAEVEHGSVELRDETFFGVDIKRAYVITCRRPEGEALPKPAESAQDAAHG